MAASDDDTPRPPKPFEEVVDGETASRTAAHEAGHILPAWLSWAVATVDGTVFRGDRVSVERTFRRPYHALQLWEALVISSGGMAGEALTHLTFRTRNSRVDINAMRTQLEVITRHFGPAARPPWPEPSPHRAPPFESFFKDGLPDGWGELMRSAYRRARDVILANRGAFERLRTAMLVKMELTTEEIGEALRLPKT